MIKSTTTKAGFFIKNVSKSAVMNGVFHESEYTGFKRPGNRYDVDNL